MRLDEAAQQALGQLDLATESDDARRAAIVRAEPIVLAAMGEGRWDLVVDLAGALAEAYALESADERCREWAAVALDAARSLEGDDGGSATVAALERVGRIELDEGDLEAAHATFLQAIDVAERAFGPDAPALVDLLLFACAGATPDFAVDLSTRALDLAEQLDLPRMPVLLEVASAMIDAERAEDAVVYALRAVDLAEQTEDEDDTAAHGLLAQALLEARRPIEAREVLDRVPVDGDPWLVDLRTRILASLEQVTRRARPLETQRR